MNKKLDRHIIDIASCVPAFCHQYTDGSVYYAIDGHRAIQYDSAIESDPMVPINAHAESRTNQIKSYINSDDDFVRFHLPTTDEIKKGISNVAGRKYSMRVIYGNDKFAINARYLLKAMEALNATVCYISPINPHKCGIFLYEDDDLTSLVKELILPVCRIDESNVGFFSM